MKGTLLVRHDFVFLRRFVVANFLSIYIFLLNQQPTKHLC